MQAVIKQAMVPATRALIATFDMSGTLLLAMGPSPPNTTPIDAMFENPHRA